MKYAAIAAIAFVFVLGYLTSAAYRRTEANVACMDATYEYLRTGNVAERLMRTHPDMQQQREIAQALLDARMTMQRVCPWVKPWKSEPPKNRSVRCSDNGVRCVSL